MISVLIAAGSAALEFSEPHTDGPRTLVSFSLGLLSAAWIASHTWGLLPQLRYLVSTIVGITPWMVVFLSLPRGTPLAGTIAAAATTACLYFLYERGVAIEIHDDRIVWTRSFPWRSRKEIPWNRVQSVRVDARDVVDVANLPIEDQRWIEVRDDANRIAFHSVLYRAEPADVRRILESASPHAVRWTVERIRDHGEAALGPVILRRGELAWKRSATHAAFRHFTLQEHFFFGLFTAGLFTIVAASAFLVQATRGWRSVRWEALKEIDSESGSIVLRTSEGTARIPVRLIPNGPYLKSIVTPSAS